MGAGASHHRSVEHVGKVDVVHVDALPPDAPQVLEAPYRAPDHPRRPPAPGAPGARASPDGPGIPIRHIDRLAGRPGQAAPPGPASPSLPLRMAALPSAARRPGRSPPAPRDAKERRAPGATPPSVAPNLASSAIASRRNPLYDALLGPRWGSASPTLPQISLYLIMNVFLQEAGCSGRSVVWTRTNLCDG